MGSRSLTGFCVTQKGFSKVTLRLPKLENLKWCSSILKNLNARCLSTKCQVISLVCHFYLALLWSCIIFALHTFCIPLLKTKTFWTRPDSSCMPGKNPVTRLSHSPRRILSKCSSSALVQRVPVKCNFSKVFSLSKQCLVSGILT